jgi:hypothetical protein
MTSRFVRLKQKQVWLRPACLAIVSLAAVFAAGDFVYAASARKETSVASIESHTAGEPIMAIVSLREQRITVSGSPPPPCNARLDRHDVARIRDVESHIWLTI